MPYKKLMLTLCISVGFSNSAFGAGRDQDSNKSFQQLEQQHLSNLKEMDQEFGLSSLNLFLRHEYLKFCIIIEKKYYEEEFQGWFEPLKQKLLEEGPAAGQMIKLALEQLRNKTIEALTGEKRQLEEERRDLLKKEITNKST